MAEKIPSEPENCGFGHRSGQGVVARSDVRVCNGRAGRDARRPCGRPGTRPPSLGPNALHLEPHRRRRAAGRGLRSPSVTDAVTTGVAPTACRSRRAADGQLRLMTHRRPRAVQRVPAGLFGGPVASTVVATTVVARTPAPCECSRGCDRGRGEKLSSIHSMFAPGFRLKIPAVRRRRRPEVRCRRTVGRGPQRQRPPGGSGSAGYLCRSRNVS